MERHTHSQFQALAAFRRLVPKPLTAAQIMEASVLSSGSVTSMINELLKKGLVKKSQGVEDKRTVRLTLTQEGSKRIEKLILRRSQELSLIAREFSKNERVEFVKLLKKLNELL